jgi:hypothetical protein
MFIMMWGIGFEIPKEEVATKQQRWMEPSYFRVEEP